MTIGSGPEEATKRAAYYRERAADARVKAEAARDYEARRTMLQVAGIWDYMAETAEPRAKGVVERLRRAPWRKFTRPSSHRWQNASGLLIATVGIALLVYAGVYM